jgi:hypothetical protein
VVSRLGGVENGNRREETRTRYAEVNQLAFWNASRSTAIDDWIVVINEKFAAVTRCY